MTIKIGLLLAELQGEEAEWARIWRNCFEQAVANDRDTTQPVEAVVRNVNGLPWGSAHECIEAWRELTDEGCLAILGPSNADNGRSVRTIANELKVPTFVYGCSHQLASEHTWSSSWGSAPVDALLAMSWVAKQGYRRAVVINDGAWHAREWLDYLQLGARRFGVQIVGTHTVPLYTGFEGHLERQIEDARVGVERLRDQPADVLIMACSVAAGRTAEVIHESGWDIPKIKAGAAFGGFAAWEGWVGTAIYDEANPEYRAWVTDYEQRYGPSPVGSMLDMTLSFADSVRVLLEGIREAPIHNREGLKEGLERVKVLPALAGGPGTVLSSGPHDHRIHKGRDSSVLQRYVGPGPADFVFEGYFDPSPAPVATPA